MVDPRKLNIAQLAILLRHSKWCQHKWFWGHTLRNPTGLQPVSLQLCLQGTWYCREWQFPFEYSYILSHYQSETSVLIYPKSKKRLMGISFSTILLKKQVFLSLEPILKRLFGGLSVEQKHRRHHCFMLWNPGKSFSHWVKVMLTSHHCQAYLRSYEREDELQSTF